MIGVDVTVPPAVYELKIKKDKKTGEIQYHLNKEYDKYDDLPPKVYGEIPELADIIWDGLYNNPKSDGLIATGESGCGKTDLLKLIANKGIDAGMPVIRIGKFKAEYAEAVLDFMFKANGVGFLLDEFGKNFNTNQQDQLLSMLDGLDDKKKFYLISENDLYLINRFILNRPGRLTYHLEFTKISERSLKEFCIDNRIKHSTSFFKDMFTKYKKSPKFSFDMLKGIIRVWSRNSKMTFDEVLNITNVSVLKMPEYIIIDKVKYIDDSKAMKDKDGKVIEITGMTGDKVTKSNLSNGSSMWVQIKDVEGKYVDSFPINKEDIVDANEEGDYIFSKNNMIITSKS